MREQGEKWLGELCDLCVVSVLRFPLDKDKLATIWKRPGTFITLPCHLPCLCCCVLSHLPSILWVLQRGFQLGPGRSSRTAARSWSGGSGSRRADAEQSLRVLDREMAQQKREVRSAERRARSAERGNPSCHAFRTHRDAEATAIPALAQTPLLGGCAAPCCAML